MCERVCVPVHVHTPVCMCGCFVVPDIENDVSTQGCYVGLLAITMDRQSPHLWGYFPPHAASPGAWKPAQDPRATPGRSWLQECGGTSASSVLTLAVPPVSPCAEKKCHRETYISDSLDQNPVGSGRHPPRLSLLSANSHGSSRLSGLEPGEMSVDEPFGAKALHGDMVSCSSSPSQSSGDTAGGSRGQPKGGIQDLGDGECASTSPRLSALWAPR